MLRPSGCSASWPYGMWPPRGRPGRCKNRHSTPMMAERNRKWNITLLRWLEFLFFFAQSSDLSSFVSLSGRNWMYPRLFSPVFLFILLPSTGDKFGNVIHLYERDCSIQRRHQKVKPPLKNLNVFEIILLLQYFSDFTPGSGWRVWGDETGEKARERRALRNML